MGLRNMLMLVLLEIRRRMNSDEIHFGFYFDLNKEITLSPPPFPLEIRPLFQEDISQLFFSSTNHLASNEIKERIQRLLFLNASIPTCLVAAKSNQFPCALCWLISAEENERIEHYFKSGLPQLKSNEMLLEFIFVHPEYRGKKFMEWITKKLFLQAKSKGANRAIAFVADRNKISLNATHLIGWKPFLKKKVTWKFFKRRITYEPL